jgi:hypothetical protein
MIVASDIGSLIRQDPVRKTLRYSVPIAIVVGAIIRLMAGVIDDHEVALPMSGHPHQVVPIFVQLWIFNLLGVIVTHFNSRCSRMSLGLPIAPRKLWLVRILSVVAAGVIPVAILIFIIAQGDVMFASGLTRGVLQMGARITAALVLAVILFQVPWPGVYRIAGGKRYVLYVALVSAGAVLYTIFTPQHWAYTAMPLVVALTVGLRVYAVLPSGFVVAPAEPERARPPTIAAGGTHKASVRQGNPTWRLNVTVWRTLLNTWTARAMLVLLVLYGVFFTRSYLHGTIEGSEFLFVLLWLWILVSRSIGRLHRIDPLPVSRKLSFAHVMLTGLLAMALGNGIMQVSYRFDDAPPAAVTICDHGICVPSEFWEIARDGEPPAVTSPWGESHTPRAYRLIGIGELAIYNPYEYGAEASPRFVKYQVDRAVLRIHGPASITGETASDVPLDDEFLKQAIDSGEFAVPESAGRGSDVRSKTVAVTVALLSILFVVLNLVWFQRFSAAAPIRRTRWFAILFFSVPQVLILTIAILEIRIGVDAKNTLKIPQIIARRLVEAMPVGTEAVWLASMLVVIASYLVIQRCYGGLEAPPGKSDKRFLSEY